MYLLSMYQYVGVLELLISTTSHDAETRDHHPRILAFVSGSVTMTMTNSPTGRLLGYSQHPPLASNGFIKAMTHKTEIRYRFLAPNDRTNCTISFGIIIQSVLRVS